MSTDSTQNSAEATADADALAQAAEAIADADSGLKSGGADSVSKLQAERDQFFENWKRTMAELDNYRRRVAREIEQAAKFSVQPLVHDILPALDNLQRTIQAAEQSGNIDNLLTGLRMVTKQFDEIFAKHHAVPINAVGQPFDPNLHSALTQVPTAEHPPMTVLQEIERGYRMHDRVVRPARVIVSCAPPEAG